MRLISLLSLTLMLPALVACHDRGDPAGQPPAPQPEASTQPETATAAEARMLWFEPADLSACGKLTKVAVHWNATSVAGVAEVEIIAVGAKGQERTFLTAGRTGNRETGEWMQAGSQMILRNKADGAELARAKVGSIPCT